MRKNSWIILVSLLLTLILPMNAFASIVDTYRQEGQAANKECVTSFKIESTPGLMGEKDILADLTKVLSFETHSLGEAFGLDVILNDETVLSLIGQGSDKGFLMGIPQIKDLVLEITKEEIGGYLNEQTMKQWKAVQKMNTESFKVNFDEIKNPPSTGDKIIDEWQKTKEVTIADYTDKSDKHDDATKRISMTIDNKDIATLMQSEMIKEMYNAQIESIKKMPNSQTEGLEDLNVDKITEFYKSGALTMVLPINIYTDDAGNVMAGDIVGKIEVNTEKVNEILALPSAEKGEGVQKADFTMNFTRKTELPNVKYNLDYAFAFPTENGKMDVNIALTKPVEKTENDFYNFAATFSVIDNEKKANVISINSDFLWNANKGHGITGFIVEEDGKYNALIADVNSEFGNNGIDSNIDLYLRENGDSANIEISKDDFKIAKITVNEQYKDPTGYFEKNTLSNEKTIKVLQLKEEDMVKLGEDLQPKLIAWLGGIMNKLPESVLNGIMGK